MATTVSSGPSWTDILTAIGTVATAVVAVGIALWSNWTTGKLVSTERKRNAGERKAETERDQLSQAYLVQVALGQKDEEVPPGGHRGPNDGLRRLAVMVINGGYNVITKIEVHFSYDGKSLVPQSSYQWMPGFHDVTQQLVDAGWESLPEAPIRGVLVPNQGVLFKSDTVHAQLLMDPYPIVRWSDRYGTRWEHRLGKVRRIRDDESWVP